MPVSTVEISKKIIFTLPLRSIKSKIHRATLQTFFRTHTKQILSILFAAPGSKGEKKHQCTTCSKRFASFKSLLMHFNIHKGLTKCHICDAVLSRTGNLKRHIRLKHSNIASKTDDDSSTTIKIEQTQTS